MTQETGFRQLAARIAGVLRDRGGVTAAEYAILAVGIVIVVGAAVMVIGDPLSGALGLAGQALLDGQSSLNQSGR
ncbi:Flp family type IVb pilin [Neoroseomonas soli]|uniref:Flp family type IVb pilin n=1 Tax=Neoroseomonas soli TaxID=1081025 RepID=A0A9X9X0S5_9PROT|nr:hypothetical protein [Neoroseomonas soli]MBR0673004.1 hypothetical protein [Neoroseomonas soli]